MQRQLGLATSKQLTSLGVSPAAVTRRVRAGRWHRVLPGVVRDAMTPATAAQAALAACLWGGAAALVSFRTAGSAWDLDGIRAEKPEIWVPSERRLRSELVVVHRGDVEVVDRRRIGPVPVTSPARTLIDLASVLDDEDLVAALEDAIHRGLTTPMSITLGSTRWAGPGAPGRRGCGPSSTTAGRKPRRRHGSRSGSGGRCAGRGCVRCASTGFGPAIAPTASTARSRSGGSPSKAWATGSTAAPASVEMIASGSPTSRRCGGESCRSRGRRSLTRPTRW
jgi:hypothetical protein